MTGLSRELAGYVVFQVVQAIVAGMMITLLLWYEKKMSARRDRAQGDIA
jgi:hypothetical protein